MELFKLENMRDQIKDRIVELERFTDGAYDSFRASPTGYIGGQRDSKIDEVKFLEGYLNLIEKEIEGHADTKVAKALELDRMIERSFKESIEKARGNGEDECDCEVCKANFAKIKEDIKKQRAKEAEAQKDQWKFTYNSWGNIGVLQEKIFDSREEAEGYMHEKISDCYEKSFRVSLEKISVM